VFPFNIYLRICVVQIIVSRLVVDRVRSVLLVLRHRSFPLNHLHLHSAWYKKLTTILLLTGVLLGLRSLTWNLLLENRVLLVVLTTGTTWLSSMLLLLVVHLVVSNALRRRCHDLAST